MCKPWHFSRLLLRPLPTICFCFSSLGDVIPSDCRTHVRGRWAGGAAAGGGPGLAFSAPELIASDRRCGALPPRLRPGGGGGKNAMPGEGEQPQLLFNYCLIQHSLGVPADVSFWLPPFFINEQSSL